MAKLNKIPNVRNIIEIETPGDTIKIEILKIKNYQGFEIVMEGIRLDVKNLWAQWMKPDYEKLINVFETRLETLKDMCKYKVLIHGYHLSRKINKGLKK